MTLSLLLFATLPGCGIDGERDKPNPPPLPPARFAAPADATRHLEGLVTDSTIATRSFSFVADGKRYVAVLTPSANVLVDGRAAGLDAVPSGSAARLEAQVHDDVLMVQRMSVGAEAAAAEMPAQPAAEPPVETAPPPETTPPVETP
ncbi:MAG: hypothetical protein FJ102_26595 [Deltaproteobacteria bacterium]|nr:hypothetical protein [Deltaproteobacteria bacterium]